MGTNQLNLFEAEVAVTWDEKSSPPPDWNKTKTGRIYIKSDDEALRGVAKRAHDVTSGLRTLRFAIDSIKEGYRFDDNMAAAKIKAMEKAIENLERETVLLSHILGAVFTSGAISGSDQPK